MPINNGQIQMYCASSTGGGVLATIEYDPVLTNGVVVPENQPIRNVAGAALRVENTTGKEAIITITGPTGTKFLGADGTTDVKIPPTGLTATANQLRQGAGIQTRADVGEFTLSCP